MIHSLKGTIAFRFDPYITVDVNGVGYKVLASLDILKQYTIGDTVKLFTYTHVREDLLELYGFPSFSDLQLFEALISVSGIGPKTAIGIFSIGSGGDITDAIREGNAAFFTSVPRLGSKNAQKIIIELKSKLGSTVEAGFATQGTSDQSEIVAALRTFGFTSKEAQTALTEIRGKGETTEEKIRLALKYLGK